MASLWLPAPTRTLVGTKPRSDSFNNNENPTIKPTSLLIVDNNNNNNNNNNTNKQATNASLPPRAPCYRDRCDAAAKWRSLPPDERKREKAPFVPRSLHDFDDGGAFPEIHVAQYPLHLGNPHLQHGASSRKSNNNKGNNNNNNNNNNTLSGLVASSAIVNVDIDAHGEVSYDAVVKQGTNSDKLVYSSHDDVRGGDADPDAVRLPTPDEEEEATRKTQAALEALVARQTESAKPTGSARANALASTVAYQEKNTRFVRYTPNANAPGYSTAQRIVQMVPAQLDPMMPPKHQHKKAPRGPAEDPVPVLHAPPVKLTKEERDSWNIPACISNWKNTRGYTIPLDKRLAADGRGLRETVVNANFATVSESLYVAERQAREEVKLRAKVQRQLALAEKDKRESDLRDLANRARMERSGVSASTTTATPDTHTTSDNNNNNVVPPDVQEEDDTGAAAQRERLRVARKKERERELRMENNLSSNKKQRLEDERDVSEKIALGVHTGAGNGFANQVDSRLYNQSAGLDAGFGNEDEYNTYTKPLFERDGLQKSIYKPGDGADAGGDADEQYDKLVQQGTTAKFRPDQGFAGAEGSGGQRKAPVQFEKGGGA